MGLTMIVIGAPTTTAQLAAGAAIAPAMIGVLVERWLLFAGAKQPLRSTMASARHNGLGLLEAPGSAERNRRIRSLEIGQISRHRLT
jgi:hypothetical protein